MMGNRGLPGGIAAETLSRGARRFHHFKSGTVRLAKRAFSKAQRQAAKRNLAEADDAS